MLKVEKLTSNPILLGAFNAVLHHTTLFLTLSTFPVKLLSVFIVSLFYLLELMGKSRFLTIIPIILVVRR